MAAGDNHLTALPLDVLECILITLDPRDLAAASLTCKTLNSFITSDSFMLRMLRHHLHSSSTDARALLHMTRSWSWSHRAALCYLNPFERNLLKEGSAQQLQGHEDMPYGSGGSKKLKEIPHWHILTNRGDGWQVERPPIGADPIPDHLPPEGGGCYVTSYSSSCKQQVVRFRRELGRCPRLMDHVQPVITVSEWVAGRHDCDSRYNINVDLLSSKGLMLHSWEHSVDLGPSYTGTQWVQVSHEFRQYGRGVAALRFRHSGNDRRMWAGWYGPKMTAARVELSIDKTYDAEKSPRVDASPDPDQTDGESSGDDIPDDDVDYEGIYDDDGFENFEYYADDDDNDYEQDEGPDRGQQAASGFLGNVRSFFKF